MLLYKGIDILFKNLKSSDQLETFLFNEEIISIKKRKIFGTTLRNLKSRTVYRPGARRS